MLGGIESVEICAHHRVENCVTEELESFIVGPSSVLGLHRHGTVYKCELVILDVKRVESCYAMNKNIKFLFLSEKELYG